MFEVRKKSYIYSYFNTYFDGNLFKSNTDTMSHFNNIYYKLCKNE